MRRKIPNQKRKVTTQIRVYPEDKMKIANLKRELSIIEKNDIKTSELMRRTLNIPNLKDVLQQDAMDKRRKRQFSYG